MILKNKDIMEGKKSLKESKKFHYGEEIIKFLDKYGYNKRGESFEEYRDYSTVTYMYAIPQGMRPQTPYVEFTVDADNDAFIFGEFFTDGRKGYSTEFDSVEDLEYFISNANYSNVDLTEKKSATKSIKERYEYKVDEITDIIRSNGVLFDSCNILDDYAWNIEHGKTTWLSKHAYDEISIAYANCIQYLKDEYNGKKKDELIDDLTKFFDKVISLTESKKSAKKSLKERDDTIFSKDVKRWMLSGNDINITFKDGNELVGAIYEHRKDSEDKKAECFLCEDLTADYTGDYFIVEVYNGKIYEIKFQSYDWLEHYMNESYDLMESKKSARKSMKEQFVGKGEGGYRKPRANKNNSGVCKDSNGVNHKVIFDTHVEDFIVWVDNDNYLMWDIYSAGGLKRNLLKSDLDEKLIDEIAELGKQLIYGFDTDF